MIKLAKKRSLVFPKGTQLRTPLLVPSFSSRVPKIDKIFRAVEYSIEGPILISAFDIRHGHLTSPYDWANVIFLDSGGYEVSRETDLSDVSDDVAMNANWTAEEHSEIVSAWTSAVPVVIISYDHPGVRCEFDEQIEKAQGLKLPPNALLEILLKPETTLRRTWVLRSQRRIATYNDLLLLLGLCTRRRSAN